MPKLLRSRFPVAATRPTALQLEMFAGETRSNPVGNSELHRSPAVRRWSEIEDWTTVIADEAHRSRGGQLARPQHATSKPRTGARCGTDGSSDEGRLAKEIIGSEGASCGRSAVTEEAGAATEIVAISGMDFDAPVANLDEGVAQQPAALRPVDVRTTGVRVATMTTGAVQAPGAISLAPAQPAWSCATAWLRSVDAKGEGPTQGVTAIASYVFVAAMIACTFLV